LKDLRRRPWRINGAAMAYKLRLGQEGEWIRRKLQRHLLIHADQFD
jgi:hypothetical protein